MTKETSFFRSIEQTQQQVLPSLGQSVPRKCPPAAGCRCASTLNPRHLTSNPRTHPSRATAEGNRPKDQETYTSKRIRPDRGSTNLLDLLPILRLTIGAHSDSSLRELGRRRHVTSIKCPIRITRANIREEHNQVTQRDAE